MSRYISVADYYQLCLYASKDPTERASILIVWNQSTTVRSTVIQNHPHRHIFSHINRSFTYPPKSVCSN